MRSNFKLHSVIPALAFGALALLAPAAPAQAGPRIYIQGTFAFGHRPPSYPVPLHITGQVEWRQYRDFYSGKFYHRGHRHSHARYRFPVVVGGRVAWHSYSYCQGHLFGAPGPMPILAVDYAYSDGYVYRHGGRRHDRYDRDDDEGYDGHASRHGRGHGHGHGHDRYDDEYGD